MHLHRYGNWRRVATTDIYGDGFGGMTKYPTRVEATYLRECERCGKPKTKRVTV